MKNVRKIFIILLILFVTYNIFAQNNNGIQNNAEELTNVKYKLLHIKARYFVNALPEKLIKRKPQIFDTINTVIIRCNEEEKKVFFEYVKLLDTSDSVVPIRLKYINSAELIKYLPPSVKKEDVLLTSNPNIIFFKGNADKLTAFKKDLSVIDEAKAQVKYQLLVVQYEKNNQYTWTKDLGLQKTKKEAVSEFSGKMSPIFNINFDIVSKFGYQFVMKLNFELADNKARVLADTTLNGLNGEEVKFQNTNTFRYVDKKKDTTGKAIYGEVIEITSGLMVNIKGSVSGDGMVTMSVNAQVSKQGSGGGSGDILPTTSEKIVKTKVRTRSGTPIIIGGLLQVEKTEAEQKVPGLGDVPIVGHAFKNRNSSERITEMVIYIIPYIEKEKIKELGKEERIKLLYEKYVANR